MPRDRPPGIWESLKRALGGGDARPDPGPVRPAPEPPPASPPEEPFAAPPFLLADDSPPMDLPVLDELPPPPAAASEAADSPEAADRPRLARGLASFSRSNADREKKFAHLLRDDSSGRKNR